MFLLVGLKCQKTETVECEFCRHTVCNKGCDVNVRDCVKIRLVPSVTTELTARC